MRKAFLHFIQSNRLCENHEKILVAVSGGIDSVVMLDLFQSTSFPIAIAHCNFQLRGEESDEDERFVIELAEKYKIKIYNKTCDASVYTEEQKCSIQEAARELRYAWFEELCTKENFGKVAVAQHADDQIETFFINLLRGSGVKGLKGMPVKRGMIIRPLLFAKRNEIEQYAKNRKLAFREDSSNLSDKYLRNKLRHHLLPQLEKIKKDYRQDIGKSLQYLNEDYRLIQHLLDEKMQGLFEHQGEIIKISTNRLTNEIDWQLLVYYLLSDFGFNRDVSDSVCGAIQNQSTGKLFYTDEYQLLVDRQYLILEKQKTATDKEYSILAAGDGLDKPFVLKSRLLANGPDLKIESDRAFAYFDLDKLTFPLVIRKWKNGDRFKPFGMKGSKLVSDYLVDEKVNRFEKEKIYVMESGGKIIWLIGLRVSDDLKITAMTGKVLLFQMIR
jgi:tRNA(Ile)-lysidine synthase